MDKLEERIKKLATTTVTVDKAIVVASDEKPKKKPVNGGWRPGSGRKKGGKNAITLEKERILTEVKNRIMRSADVILNSQLSLARGQQFLYRIDRTKLTGPKGGISYRNEKPVLVTSEAELEDYLEGMVNEGDAYDDKDPGAAYYYLTTKEPNNQAIEGMFNRAFGKPAEVGLDGNAPPPLQLQINIANILKKAYGTDNDAPRD